jgi:hypothetical protein
MSSSKRASQKRAVAVQLTAATVGHLDRLAALSRMSRHRYMVLILDRAVETELVLREELPPSDQ